MEEEHGAAFSIPLSSLAASLAVRDFSTIPLKTSMKRVLLKAHYYTSFQLKAVCFIPVQCRTAV